MEDLVRDSVQSVIKEIEEVRKENEKLKEEVKQYKKIRKIDALFRQYDYENETNNEMYLRTQLNEVIDRINEV